jgi:hypothetical protein
MAHPGRPTAEVELTDDERDTLERWARGPKSAQALALRCRIVLEHRREREARTLRERARITCTAAPFATCADRHLIAQVVHARALTLLFTLQLGISYFPAASAPWGLNRENVRFLPVGYPHFWPFFGLEVRRSGSTPDWAAGQE